VVYLAFGIAERWRRPVCNCSSELDVSATGERPGSRGDSIAQTADHQEEQIRPPSVGRRRNHLRAPGPVRRTAHFLTPGGEVPCGGETYRPVTGSLVSGIGLHCQAIKPAAVPKT
jgi:hypothetical protein